MRLTERMMSTENRENVFAIVAFVALVALVIAGCCWHASIVDRAVDEHKAKLISR